MRDDTKYQFTVSSSYINDNFTVDVIKNDKSRVYEKFLDVYYREKLNTDDIDKYLLDYRTNKINNIISKKFDITINFGSVSDLDYDEYYNKIPSINEIADNMTLRDPEISIYANLTTEEEILEYLINFTRFYISELDTLNVDYEYSEFKYFMYKYDYVKMGIYNYDYDYRYDGYVLAGEYKCFDPRGECIIKNEDSIITINIEGKDNKFNTSDIIGG